MGKFPSERKDHSLSFRGKPIEIFGCTVVQEAKAKIPDTVADCVLRATFPTFLKSRSQE